MNPDKITVRPAEKYDKVDVLNAFYLTQNINVAARRLGTRRRSRCFSDPFDQLVEEGYLRRREDPKPNESWYEVTEKGIQLLEQTPESQLTELESF